MFKGSTVKGYLFKIGNCEVKKKKSLKIKRNHKKRKKIKNDELKYHLRSNIP